MTSKADFNEAEWNALLASPVLTGLAVTSAEPSGLIGLVQEGMAGARILSDELRTSSGLIKALVDDMSTGDGRARTKAAIKARTDGASKDTIRQKAESGVDEALRIVGRIAPSERAAFGDFLVRIAEQTANAAKEGGFLGFGGERVTASEQAALDEIKRMAAGAA